MQDHDYLELVKESARAICQSYHGQVLLGYLANKFFVGSTVFRPGLPDQTNFNEGNRLVVLHIMDLGGMTKMEDVLRCLKSQMPQETVPEKPE